MAFKQVHCCLCCSSSNGGGGGGGGLMISIFVLLLLKFVALGGCANGQFVKYIKFCSPHWHFLNFHCRHLFTLGQPFVLHSLSKPLLQNRLVLHKTKLLSLSHNM